MNNERVFQGGEKIAGAYRSSLVVENRSVCIEARVEKSLMEKALALLKIDSSLVVLKTESAKAVVIVLGVANADRDEDTSYGLPIAFAEKETRVYILHQVVNASAIIEVPAEGNEALTETDPKHKKRVVSAERLKHGSAKKASGITQISNRVDGEKRPLTCDNGNTDVEKRLPSFWEA